MALIKIDTDGLQQQANALNGMVSSYEGLISQTKNLTDLIGQGWEGAASQAYQQKLGEYVQQATVLTSALAEFRKYAMSAAQEFAQTDSECAHAIHSSF